MIDSNEMLNRCRISFNENPCHTDLFSIHKNDIMTSSKSKFHHNDHIDSVADVIRVFALSKGINNILDLDDENNVEG